MASGRKKGRTVKPKKRCCKSRTRCRRCPVVLKRLERNGLAAFKGKVVVLSPAVTKADLAVARRRA